MSEKRCEKCVSYYVDPGIPIEEVDDGLCRIRSPIVVGDDGFGAWPRVYPDDACEEFRPSERSILGPPLEAVVKSERDIQGHIIVACAPGPVEGDCL